MVARPPLRLVVTGVTGFVGSALLRELEKQPEGSVQVRALVRGPRQPHPYPWLQTVAGALPTVPEELFFSDGPQVLIHFGSKQVDKDGSGFTDINVEGTRALMQAMPPSCRAVLYGSSVSVYGQGPQQGEDENAKLAPATPLAHSRAEAERIIIEATDRLGCDGWLLRPRFVVGHGDRFTLPALQRLKAMRVSVGSGNQAFSVIDVDDYAAALVLLARRCAESSTQAAGCRPLHVGYRRPITLNEMLGAIGDPSPTVRIPGGALLPRLLRAIPVGFCASLATKLELVGLPHWVNCDALGQVVGSALVDRDPLDAIANAVARVQRPSSPTPNLAESQKKVVIP